MTILPDKIPSVELRMGLFDKKILDLTYNWLNDPEIQALIDSKPVEYEKQQEWFDRLPSRKDFLIYSIWHNDTPIGVLGLKNVTSVSAEYWGYLGKKEYWGRGIGIWMVEEAVRVAKENNLPKIYLKVLPSNYRAIRLYQKKGFLPVEHQESLRIIKMEKIII